MFNSESQFDAQLPGLVVKNIIPLPKNELRLEIKTDEEIKLIKICEQYKNHVLLLVPSFEQSHEFNEYGVVARIVLNMAGPSGGRYIKVQSVVRAKIKDVIDVDDNRIVDFITVPSISENIDEEVVTTNLIEKELKKNPPIIDFNNPTTLANLKKGNNSADFSDYFAYALKISPKEKLRYLNEPIVGNRLKYILEDLHKGSLYKELEQKIDENVKKSISESQKEYYLREKMRAIQEELGEKAKKDSDVEELRNNIKKANMPKAVFDKAMNELNRYITSPSNSAESGIIRTYLDFVVKLPWSNSSVDSNSIKAAQEELDKDHYGLEKVKDRILEYLAVKILNNKNPQTILCLVGPPGVGKTSLAKSIAKALNKKFVKQALGGVKDESEIRGHRRTYLGALPGRILQGITRAGTNNPVFLLDEIDKLSSDYKGDPTSALLEVLDSEQNQFFSDHYLEEPFDLSNVFFIATANYLEYIPAPLRDRLEIVELSSYTEYEKFEIAKRHLLSKQLKLHGLKPELFSITDQAIYKIIQEYTREAGVRELERYLGSIIRKSIKNILLGDVDMVNIDVDNLVDYLGKPKYTHNTIDQQDQVGVVTGLAYTQFGGDTLSIEVTHYKGTGKLVLTGKLGDVMKESAQAALSYVKTNATAFGINFDLFDQCDVHIHVPEGATPKDGPSAGVTITTAIVSSFANRLVDHTVGMTGEITLRGNVLPIGGLREKSIAAVRSGLKTILIPIDNVKDLEDVPESVKNTLNIIPVKSIDEVIKYTLK